MNITHEKDFKIKIINAKFYLFIKYFKNTNNLKMTIQLFY